MILPEPSSSPTAVANKSQAVAVSSRRRYFWQPPTSTSVKLLSTGATVGTVVDSLHNQVLLQYHVAPFAVPSPLHENNAVWLASSWTVPPLLAVTYLLLGGILPRIMQKMFSSAWHNKIDKQVQAPPLPVRIGSSVEEEEEESLPSLPLLQNRAVWAVTTTAMIVKLSDVLERHHATWNSLVAAAQQYNEHLVLSVNMQHLVLLFTAALLQWLVLDGTAAALLLAAVTAYVGPLAELPFVQAGIWTYLPDAANYLPLHGQGLVAHVLSTALLRGDGDDNSITSLAISTVSAPCYFAVCMDAIALGRWFDAQHDNEVLKRRILDKKNNRKTPPPTRSS